MLDWNRFESLPGAATENFEKLCRGIVRRQFGFLGPLRELKNQPGVEYHVELNQDDERLGKAGQIVGWQCKWFQYKTGGNLTSSAKEQIKHSLDRTREHLPNLNRWILWTHKTLSKPDQDWYYNLKSEYGFELHLWNESDLDQLLSGAAIDLRQSYFGELALTPQMLVEQHEISIAPIKSRWIHIVHQRMKIEQQVRLILGEPDAWKGFANIRQSLLKELALIKAYADEPQYELWQTELIDFANDSEMYSSFCMLFHKSLNGADIERIDEMLGSAVAYSLNPILKVLRKLRHKNLPLSIAVTNALAFIKDTKSMLESAQELLSHQFVAVVADAGGGKTQFAAEITAPGNNRPAGILLLGRSLKKGGNLDSLAQQINFYNQPVSSFGSLIAAVDAAGTRAGCRLPIVIDGLNEAQDPREWKPLLEAAHPILRKFKNVVLICTLRTGEKERPRYWYRQHSKNEPNTRENFAQQALPDDSYAIESKGFNNDLTLEAIKAYFNHYKIVADPLMAPLDFFSHPLNLKIFCEVTNRKAEKNVQVAYFPSSIYSLFKKQIEHSATIIASMTNLGRRYYVSDVERAVYNLGECIWEEGTRSVSENCFRDSANMPLHGWEEDIVNLLAQEGVLFRDVGDEPYSYMLTPVYDRLGGFLTADYLLRKNARLDLVNWMQGEGFLQKIFGDVPEQHELSEDILHALIALAPKYKFQQQVWQALPSKYASKALSLSYLIDQNDFCNETKEAYREQIIKEKLPDRTIDHLLELRKVVGHPLNADFLNEVLKELSVADRDLSWTEHNRIDYRDRISAIKNLIDNWRSGNWADLEVERLRAVSISWLLTSTCIELRDSATEALFYYGLHTPAQLFKITTGLLTVNDPYVSERLLAASYGVATTLLLQGEAYAEVSNFSLLLHKAMFANAAEAATTHLLGREYASCILQAVYKFVPGVIDQEQLQSATHPFSLMPRKNWGVVLEDERTSRSESPFRMDFENYTIGRLVSGRSNYNYEHSEYKNVRGKILWRIKNLGWDARVFSEAERNTESDGGYSSRMNRSRIERYGKKYSWIAYYEMAGQLEDEEKLDLWRERFATDIDPFFPLSLPPEIKDNNEFLGYASVMTEEWISETKLSNLDSVLISNELKEHSGSWVLIDGFISEESKRLDRNFYCSIGSFFISTDNYAKINKFVDKSAEINWPELPQSSYIYSGELYWSARADFEEQSELQVVVGYKIKEIEIPVIGINGEIFSEGGKKFIEVPQYESLDVHIPTIKYYWENGEGDFKNIDRVLLAPWVVEILNLRFNPTRLTYTDSDGTAATIFSNQKGEASGNYQNLLYLRKDLVEKLAELKDMELIWRVKGERRYARTEHFYSDKNGSVWYKDFEFIKAYPE